MKIQNIYSALLLVLLSLAAFASCDNGLTGDVPGVEPDSGNMQVTQIGSSYMDLEYIYDYGTVFTDSMGNIFVYSEEKKQILRYSEASGFIEIYEENASGLLTSPDSPYFFIETYNDYEIYSIQSNLTKTLVETVQFNSTIDQGGFINVGINTGYVVLADDNASQTIDVEIFSRSAKTYNTLTIDAGENVYNVYGLALSENTAFVISWQETGRKLYMVDLASRSLRETYDLAIGNFDYIQFVSGILYIGDNNGFTGYTLDGNDSITATKDYAIIDNRFEIYNSSFYGGNFYSIGRENGKEVIMKYSAGTETNATIYDPVIPDNALFDTWAMAVDGSNAYIGCGSNIKVFEDGVYQSIIPLVTVADDYKPSNIAINSSGVLGTTHNGVYMGYVDSSDVFRTTASSDLNLYGISVLDNDNFILRQRGGSGDTVTEYDIATGSFNNLFTLTDENITSDNLTVLPGDVLVLNWDNQLKKYSGTGTLLLSGPVYSFQSSWISIRDMVYSPYWEKIIMIADDNNIYFINPDTLAIENAYDPPGVVSSNNIDVNASGEVFIGTYNNEVFKILINKDL